MPNQSAPATGQSLPATSQMAHVISQGIPVINQIAHVSMLEHFDWLQIHFDRVLYRIDGVPNYFDLLMVMIDRYVIKFYWL